MDRSYVLGSPLLNSFIQTWGNYLGKQTKEHQSLLETTWQDFSAKAKGMFLQEHDLFGFTNAPKVLVSVKPWTITFGTHVVAGPGDSWITKTWVRAPYVSKDGFTFKVYRPGLLSRLSVVTKVDTGHPEFDQECVIQPHGEPKAQALIENAKIRQLAQSLLLNGNKPMLRAEERDRNRQYQTLCYEESGIITDISRLRSILELITETLIHLYHIGSASKEVPEFHLAPSEAHLPRWPLRDEVFYTLFPS